MQELRWILIAFGLALLIGIYVWGRRSTKSSAADDSTFRARPEPVFEADSEFQEASLAATEPTFVEEEASVEPEIAEPVAAVDARAYSRTNRVDESREPTLEAEVQRSGRDHRYSRIEPTLSDDAVTAELPASDPEPIIQPRPSSTPADAPTLSMSSTPPPRRIERRKIIALRLATGLQRVPGAQLRAVLEAESLQHGKYDVFHRLDENGVAIFSVASIVEPGTFNLEKMSQETYPGITLFTQLPGPLAGMLAFNELISCSRRLHAALGGTLQDERGVPLTVHRIERIRQEIREFEHRPAADTPLRSTSTLSSSP